MIRPTSKTRSSVFLKDFQVLKGGCEKTMQAFGSPVFTAHEARLMIQNDRQKMPAGSSALYVIHHRSKNKIIQIIESNKAALVVMPKTQNTAGRFPLPKAA